MFQALNFAFITELKEIKNSWYKLMLITLFPIISFAFLIAIFSKGVASDLPIVVVDNDKSQFSKKLLFNIDASSTIDIKYRLNDTKEAMKLIKSSKAYALVEIPPHFQRDILLHIQPKVTAMLNTQYILIGKIIKATLVETVAHSAAELEYVKNLFSTQNTQESIHTISPVALQITPFFNTYKNYFLFLISALLPSVWQIFIVIATIVSFGTLFKAKKEKEFFKGSHIEMKIIGKLLPYTIAFMLLGIGYLFYIYGTKNWIFQGSFAVMIFGMFLTVIAYQAVALVLFVTGFDYARALSLGAVYTAPAFAFLGVTFPTSSMNTFAVFWRDLLPISYYMELQISQANYGADIFLELDKLFYLSLFTLVFIPVFIRFHQRLAS
jgi:ABC-2 type transport system permease protein